MVKRIFYRSFRRFFSVKQWSSQRFTPAGKLVIIGIFASALMGIDTRRSMAYQVFTFLAALLLISIISSKFFKKKFTARRILPPFATAGMKLPYTVEILSSGKKKCPGLYIRELPSDPRPSLNVFLNTPEPGESQRNIFDRTVGFYRWEWLIRQKRMFLPAILPLPPLSSRAPETVHCHLTPERRGILHLDGLDIIRPDALALVNTTLTVPLPQSIAVLPRRYSLPSFRLPGHRRYHSGGIALTSSVGDSEEFISLREYRPGDPLRRIHWKSWAKTGKPIVKEYQDEFFVRHALVLDTFQSVEYSDIFEEAVSVAASFACTVQTQESLLDLIFVGTQICCITSGRGLGQPDKSLEVLAAVRPCTDRPFKTLTDFIMPRTAGLSGCIIILLTWDKERERLVRQLETSGITSLVMIITDSGTRKSIKQRLKKTGMHRQTTRIHLLETGRIEAGLSEMVKGGETV